VYLNSGSEQLSNEEYGAFISEHMGELPVDHFFQRNLTRSGQILMILDISVASAGPVHSLLRRHARTPCGDVGGITALLRDGSEVVRLRVLGRRDEADGSL
jgi:hypothetical protein